MVRLFQALRGSTAFCWGKHIKRKGITSRGTAVSKMVRGMVSGYPVRGKENIGDGIATCCLTTPSENPVGPARGWTHALTQ